MPFLSTKDTRETMQTLTPAKNVIEPEFSEVFAAGVGQTIDEELSISRFLNMEGFNQRKQRVKELGDSGQFNLQEYTSPVGDVNYDKIAKDFPDFNVKDDRTLFDERAQLLKQRREYSQDVFERGSGMAQFLGMANAFMLDPINIATMPIATAGTATKSLTALGRALTVAKNEAGLAIAAEMMIQPLVYQHKHDINSPFEFSDALTNIATAATGAAVIGAATGGISGYFKAVREKASTQPLTDDAAAGLQSLARVEDDLNLNPERINLDFKQLEKDFIEEIKTEFIADASQKITRGERKALTSSLNDLENRLSKITEEQPEVIARQGVPARKAKAEAQAEVKRVADEQRLELRTQIDAIKTKLKADEIGAKAEASLSRIEQGIIPDEYKKRLDQIKFEKELEVDSNYLRDVNNKMEAVNPPAKKAENYEIQKTEPITTGTINQRERSVLQRQGIESDYDADIQAFKALQNPKIIQGDEVVDAGDFMKSIDDEIAGMDDILRCAIG